MFRSPLVVRMSGTRRQSAGWCPCHQPKRNRLANVVLDGMSACIGPVFHATLGPPELATWGPFVIATLAGGLFVRFAEPNVAEIQMQYYAFLVDDASFDAIYERIGAARIEHAVDPRWKQPNQIGTNHGGRGISFLNPAGHGLEVITRPYGSAD